MSHGFKKPRENFVFSTDWAHVLSSEGILADSCSLWWQLLRWAASLKCLLLQTVRLVIELRAAAHYHHHTQTIHIIQTFKET